MKEAVNVKDGQTLKTVFIYLLLIYETTLSVAKVIKRPIIR